LFGKRSDVSDAHDRHANVEVAYLLQRMERFDGVAILATNLRANIDEAFTRRLDVIVHFVTPEVDARRLLWERHLPETLPRADDLDLDLLAERFDVAGGVIRNIALTAAYRAAQENSVVTMGHLVRAVANEYTKMGRLLDLDRFGPYVHELEADPEG
jgi:SpoVK/Ycf46/Vps4 family AAA+-type ATPase